MNYLFQYICFLCFLVSFIESYNIPKSPHLFSVFMYQELESVQVDFDTYWYWSAQIGTSWYRYRSVHHDTVWYKLIQFGSGTG